MKEWTKEGKTRGEKRKVEGTERKGRGKRELVPVLIVGLLGPELGVI